MSEMDDSAKQRTTPANTTSPPKLKIIPEPVSFGAAASAGRIPLQQHNKFGECLREMILQNKIEEPLVFRKIHQDWGPCKWTLGDWGDMFRDEKLSVRFGRQDWNHDHPQWESLCGTLEITWMRMIEWVRGEFKLPVKNSSPSDIWMYYDYKYLPEVIHIKSGTEKDFLKLIYLSENLKKMFSWSLLGFPDRNGDHSTLWIGTAGSYTNTHFDTYSSNLVCQVYGKKTWLLFPPCDTDLLRPTRVPYEESSVYSQINLASSKQIKKNWSALSKCTPRKVTLEPGDCLYLPPKWWHFVKSEDLSISVNTWIELPSDHFTRVEEAVLRAVVASVVNSSVPSTADRILNPNEMDLTETSDRKVEETLNTAAKAYLDHIKSESERLQSSSEQKDSDGEPVTKKPKLSPDELNLQYLMENAPVPVENLKTCDLRVDLNPQPSSSSATDASEENSTSSNLQSSSSSGSSGSEQKRNETSSYRSPTYLENAVNAIGHPSVLEQIALQFLNNVKQRNASD